MRISKTFISLMSFMLGFIIGSSLKVINVTSKLDYCLESNAPYYCGLSGGNLKPIRFSEG